MVGILILCALVAICLVTVLNALTFPRLKPAMPEITPFVSVLIPARNEAAVIASTVRMVLAQDYPQYELIIVDDASADNTLGIALAASGGDPRLRLVQGKPLPAGWAGKNWACQQLSELAKGELLLFTDADVRWEPQGISAVVACMQEYAAGAFTVWPTQETVSWAERLVVPLMMFSIISYLPEIAVRRIPWSSFAAANGQCLAFQRAAYQQLGGHQAVKETIVEDIQLARRSKDSGMRLVMSLGNDLVHGRMYSNWHQVREGFAKNILAGHGDKPIFLLISAIFHWLLFLVPWIWLLAGFFIHGLLLWPWLPLTALTLGTGARALSAAVTRHRLSDALFMPLSVLLMSVIAAQSLWWHYRQGGPRWKGRLIDSRSSGLVGR